MKRNKLLKYLLRNGCQFLREGKSHSIYFNTRNNKVSTVPRHPDIKQFTVEKICKDLEIGIPSGK